MPYYLLCSCFDIGQTMVISFTYQTGRIALRTTFLTMKIITNLDSESIYVSTSHWK